MPSKYGFNALALASISNQLKDKSDTYKVGTLLTNEIKLRKGLSFDKLTGKFDILYTPRWGTIKKNDEDNKI